MGKNKGKKGRGGGSGDGGDASLLRRGCRGGGNKISRWDGGGFIGFDSKSVITLGNIKVVGGGGNLKGGCAKKRSTRSRGRRGGAKGRNQKLSELQAQRPPPFDPPLYLPPQESHNQFDLPQRSPQLTFIPPQYSPQPQMMTYFPPHSQHPPQFQVSPWNWNGDQYFQRGLHDLSQFGGGCGPPPSPFYPSSLNMNLGEFNYLNNGHQFGFGLGGAPPFNFNPTSSQTETMEAFDFTKDEYPLPGSPPCKKESPQTTTSSPGLERPFNLLLHNPDQLTFLQFKALNLSQQLTMLLSGQVLSFQEVEIREAVICQILRKLQQLYPQCRLIPFGSFPLGMADSTSDIDLYVDLYPEGDDHVPPVDIDPETALEVRRKMFHLFQMDSHWMNVELLRNCGVVIQMRHKQSGIRCDLSFANCIAVEGSRLLQVYMRLDERVRPFLTFLRAWIQWQGLSGYRKMKKYAVSLMGLVILMEMGVIPTVEQLQNWNGKRPGLFLENVEEIRRIFGGNRFSGDLGQFLVVAVERFWERFAELDFGNLVICPAVGKMLARQKGNEWIGPLCVQDPLEWSCNVGKLKCGKTLTRFKNVCRKARDRLKERKGQVDTILELFVVRSMRDSETGEEEDGGLHGLDHQDGKAV